MSARPDADEVVREDFFALLGLPRHPWVDVAALKNRYHAAASQTHPDHVGGNSAHFLRLGEAVSCLRDPATRLFHLVAVEFGPSATKGRYKPPVDLFQEVAGALRQANSAALQTKIAHTPLGQAAAIAATKTAAAELKKVQSRTEEALQRLETTCREAGDHWADKGADFWAELAAEARYLGKWQRQLSDQIFRLSHFSPAGH
jgi:hypothetical protein